MFDITEKHVRWGLFGKEEWGKVRGLVARYHPYIIHADSCGIYVGRHETSPMGNGKRS